MKPRFRVKYCPANRRFCPTVRTVCALAAPFLSPTVHNALHRPVALIHGHRFRQAVQRRVVVIYRGFRGRVSCGSITCRVKRSTLASAHNCRRYRHTGLLWPYPGCLTPQPHPVPDKTHPFRSRFRLPSSCHRYSRFPVRRPSRS